MPKRKLNKDEDAPPPRRSSRLAALPAPDTSSSSAPGASAMTAADKKTEKMAARTKTTMEAKKPAAAVTSAPAPAATAGAKAHKKPANVQTPAVKNATINSNSTADSKTNVKTNANPKKKAKTNTQTKKAKSTIKTPEKAAAGPKSANAKSKAGGTNKTKRGETSKTKTEMTATKTASVNQATVAAAGATLLPAPAPGTQNTNDLPVAGAAAPFASVPKDTTDPNRPIFHPSSFPHIMSAIIAMSELREQMKFRGVSRWCQQEAHRIIMGPNGGPHAYRGDDGYNWQGLKAPLSHKLSPSKSLSRNLEWTVQVIDYGFTLFWWWSRSRCDARLVLAHTARHRVDSSAVWEAFFPPSLKTVILFFELSANKPPLSPIAPTSALVNPKANPRSGLPAPTITKVVLNISPFPACASAAANEWDLWWERLFMPIRSSPSSVTDLTVVFGIPLSTRSVLRSAKELQHFWDKMAKALSSKTDATVVTLVDVAAVLPDTLYPHDASTFEPIHAGINEKCRLNPINNLQITVMTRGEYKAKVGEKQFMLDTVWR